MQIVAPYLRKKVESFNDDEDFAEFRAQLKEAADNSEGIKLLSLTGNSYGIGFFTELAPYLENIETIERLSLSDIFTTRLDDLIDSLEILSGSLMGKKTRLLDLSHNAITPPGYERIFGYLKSCSELEYLYANNTGVGQNGTKFITDAIEQGQLPLKLLSLTRNRIEVKAAIIGETLKACCPDLETLIMFQNGIREEGMGPLMEAAISAKAIKHVAVNDNWISGFAQDKLYTLLEGTPSLEELTMGDAQLTAAESARVMQSMVKGTQVWKTFQYDYNDLTEDETAIGMFKALARGKALQEVSFIGCEISPAAQEQIKLIAQEAGLSFKKSWEDIFEDDLNASMDSEELDVASKNKKEFVELIQNYSEMKL